jgi:hypothetical protein
MTLFYDRATISGQARITPEGYFVADALVARANNIQDYRAHELGLTDRDPQSVVRVFRPEAEVFAADSLKTAARLPITLDHPAEMVDARNWREFTRGQTGDDILRDGEYVRVPLRVTDAAAVASVQTDRQEFSLGYTANIKLQSGVHDGQAYDAIATDLRYNHLAACRAARGGPELRIVDERTTAPNGGTTMPNLVIVDGIPVDAANPAVAEPCIRNLVTARDTALQAVTDGQAALATANTTIAARDAEISNLKDALEKAKLGPQALRDAAASYSRTVAKAKALGATVTDAMDEPALIAAAVRHKLGDKAAGYTTPEQFAAAFDALEVPAGTVSPTQTYDALADIVGNQPANVGDAVALATKARDARYARFAQAHQGGDRSTVN